MVKLTDILFKNKYGRGFLIINLFWGLILTIISIVCGSDRWIYSLGMLLIYIVASVVVWQMGRKFPVKEKDRDVFLKLLIFAMGVFFCLVLLLYNPENAVAIYGSALTSFASTVVLIIKIEGFTNVRKILFGDHNKPSVNSWIRGSFYTIGMFLVICLIIFTIAYRILSAVKSLYSYFF